MKVVGGLKGAGAVGMAALALACGSGASDEQSKEPKALPTGPFAVTDYYSPRPLITASEADKVRITSGASCKERPQDAQGACFRFEAQGPTTYGFVFEYPGFEFGKGPGLTLPSSITKLRFSAATDADTPPTRINLKIGWSAVSAETPYGEVGLSQAKIFSLSAAWQTFEIPLEESGSMVGNALGMEALGPATFYLDDLYFE